jgi:hypothetical protein
VLSLLYRASADPAEADANASADRDLVGADHTPSGAEAQRPGAGVLTKRAQAAHLRRTQR